MFPPKQIWLISVRKSTNYSKKSEYETDESKLITIMASNNINDILSNDLLLKILVRLPSDCCRFLIQCGTVCKLWHSLINSTDYCNLRRLHDQSQSQSQFLPSAVIFRNDYYSDLSQPLYEYSATRAVAASGSSGTCYLDFLPWPKVRIYSSFDDLLLVSHEDNNFLICNPLTRQYLDLPKPPPGRFPMHEKGHGGLVFEPDIRQQRKLNLKLDLSQVRYRVMLQRYHDMDDDDWICFRVATFCSETGKWSESTLTLRHPNEWLNLNTPVSCNGMLHWLAKKNVFWVIAAVDPFKDTNHPKYCRFINFPSGLVQGQGRSSFKRARFGSVRGQLRVTQLLGNKRAGFVLKVWELNYDKDVDDNDGFPWTWSLVHDVEVKRLNTRHKLFVLAFHPDNGNVMYFLCKRNLVCQYDIGEEKMEKLSHLPSKHFMFRYPEYLYTYTLVHHLWPTPIPGIPSV